MTESIIQLSSIVGARLRQLSAEIEGETIVLNFEDGMYYALDSVGAFIWSLVQSPRRVSEIRDRILDEYEVGPDRCEADLVRLLAELQRLSLVEVMSGEEAGDGAA
ncbi:MAG: PqqD family protein [Planctomycetota bacterium]